MDYSRKISIFSGHSVFNKLSCKDNKILSGFYVGKLNMFIGSGAVTFYRRFYDIVAAGKVLGVDLLENALYAKCDVVDITYR